MGCHLDDQDEKFVLLNATYDPVLLAQSGGPLALTFTQQRLVMEPAD
jgi:hypothetical protein